MSPIMSDLGRECERILVALECGILSGDEAMDKLHELWDVGDWDALAELGD